MHTRSRMLLFFVPVILIFCSAMASLALISYGPQKTRQPTDWTFTVADHRLGLAGDHQATVFHLFSPRSLRHRTFASRIGFADTVHYLGLLSGIAAVALYLWFFVRNVDDIHSHHLASDADGSSADRIDNGQ